MAIDVKVWVAGKMMAHTWALNEAAVEKGNRERMLEVVTEVDGRPMTSFGCDGVVMATPTGSTAYAFSAGGPVVWPGVEALLMSPISAHALFAKPLVVAPDLHPGRGDPDPERRQRRALVRRPAQRWICPREPAWKSPGRPCRSGWPEPTRRRSPNAWSASSSCPPRAGAAPVAPDVHPGATTPEQTHRSPAAG